MKYRKEDLPKIIVLSLVLVAAVIWAVVANVRSFQRYAGGRSPGTGAAGAGTSAATQQAAPTSTATPPAMWAGLLTPVPPPSRDPFDPVIAPRWQREASRSTPEPSTPAPPAAVPPLPGSTVGDSLHLTGIIYGPPSIVVIRKGEDAHILRQGDYLEGGLRVDNVTRNSVTLRDRQGSYTLRLGE